MAIRLIAVDLDGTLLPRSQVIPAETRKAVERVQAAGMEFCFCTGRAAAECRDLFPQLPAMRYGSFCTGANILDLQNNTVLAQNALTADEARALYAIVREYDCCISFIADGVVHNSRAQVERFAPYTAPAILEMFARTHVIEDDLDGFVARYDGPVEKFYVSFLDKTERDTAYARAAQLPYYITDAGFNDFEIMRPGVDKGVGLTQLAALLGFTAAEVAAVGDSSNDLPMLRCAGLSVAMGNASDAVRAAADVVVADNEHGGMAEILNRIAEGEFDEWASKA